MSFRFEFQGYYFKIKGKAIAGFDLKNGIFVYREDINKELIAPFVIITSALFFKHNRSINVEKLKADKESLKQLEF